MEEQPHMQEQQSLQGAVILQTKLNFEVKHQSPNHEAIKRRSQIELQQEKTDLKNLLKERFEIPQNNGTLPQAEYQPENLGTWVYPASKSFRTYQFKIVRTSLFQNTLVTLPTGLGKTFIASTVMFNFYRWFKDGMIFFVAPTKPLVTQQIESFSNLISEVPMDHIAELTGTLSKQKRQKMYKVKRVFFMTPQTLQKDIESNILDCSKIVLLIIDEAHRATGNYAYCRIIQHLEAQNVGFRIVSLSATPVSKIENLQTIVSALRVSMFEVRDDEDEEIKQYTFDKNIVEIVVEKEDHITEMENKMYRVMGLALAFLKQVKLIPQTMIPKYLNKMNLLQMQDTFRGQMSQYAPSMIGCVFERISCLLSLSHAKKLLLTHGVDSFSSYITNYFDLNQKDKKNAHFLKDVKATTEFKELQTYIDDTKSTMKHPKLKKLSELLTVFFSDESHKQSKAIIFSSFRESAHEVKRFLDAKNQGTVFAEVFVGQNNGGLSQKFQAAMIKKFKDGKINTLIATCVAEEGLDIGNVDLIISYDCLASPIRMIQRFGRTGRQGSGQVIILIAKGEEEQKLKMSKKTSKNIMQALKQQSKQAIINNQPVSNLRQNDQSTQQKLNFGQTETALMPALQQVQLTQQPKGLTLYSFNPRMIQEDVFPKPVYRKMIPRSDEELKILNKELERIRNSLAKDGNNKEQENEDETKKKPRKKKNAQSKEENGDQLPATKQRGRPKGSGIKQNRKSQSVKEPKMKSIDSESEEEGELDVENKENLDPFENQSSLDDEMLANALSDQSLEVVDEEEITEINQMIQKYVDSPEQSPSHNAIHESFREIDAYFNKSNNPQEGLQEKFSRINIEQDEERKSDKDSAEEIEELTENFWNEIQSFVSEIKSSHSSQSSSKKRKKFDQMRSTENLQDELVSHRSNGKQLHL